MSLGFLVFSLLSTKTKFGGEKTQETSVHASDQISDYFFEKKTIWKNVAIFKTLVLGCLKELEAGTGAVGKLRVSSFSLVRLFRVKTTFERTKPRGFATS